MNEGSRPAPAGMPGSQPGERPLAIVRWPLGLLLALSAAVPFVFAPIPPLTDVLGHIGRFAVQTAPAGDVLFRYFGFHWALTLNLGSDVIVQMLYPLGVVPVVWAVCALTPVLTTLGITAIARVSNPRGAHALPWALLFVYNFPFLWGFLNFALTAACGLIAFAAWVAMRSKPHWRAALFLVITPMLLIGHGVAGVVTIGLIVGHDAWDNSLYRPGNWTRSAVVRFATVCPPVLAGVVTLALWKAIGTGDGGRTVWLSYRKTEAIVMMLRDQELVLDVGSVVACAVVWGLGRYWGARTSRGGTGAIVVVTLLFLATPSLISGSDRIDTRLAPLIPMLAFALQDWSPVPPRRRRIVTAFGFVLLAVRLGITAMSFQAYHQRYARELSALDHVPRGARILNLALVDCGTTGWRSERLEHLANLATLQRSAWVNAHWSISGLQLLDVKYRPSPAYYRDPSQLIWPGHCVDPTTPYRDRDRHMLLESMPRLPLGKVDYLWLLGDRLPAHYAAPRLRLIWSDDISQLFATRASAPISTPMRRPS